MKKEQIKCPACGSFKTFDQKITYISGGVLMTLFFLPSLFFFYLIFPIVLIGAGLLVIIVGIKIKEDQRIKCNGCGFLFIKS